MSIALMDQYIEDVKKGKLLSGKLAIASVNRHLKDLKELPKKGYYFNREEADRAILLVMLMKHTKGELKGQHFHLQPFQAFIVGSIFGWYKSNNFRRFNEAYIEIARKNGKTELAAAIAIVMFIFDNENAAEIYTAAMNFKQASICFDMAKSMLRMLSKDSATVKDMISILKYNITVPGEGSKFEPVHAKAETQDGYSPHCAINDEFHSHPDNSMRNIMKTGMGGRRQPLLLNITTAGYNLQGPCYALREVAIDIVTGKKEDEALFTIIFTLDKESEWTNKDMWIKANPNIGKAPYWEFMLSEFNKAKNEGGQSETDFKTKNLNWWVNAKVSWINDARWRSCKKEFDTKEARKLPCYIAIDLAASKDLACVMEMYVDEPNNLFYFIPKFFMPEDTAINRSRSDRVDYMKWANQGYIQITEGDTIDQDYIKNYLTSISNTIDIQAIDYDPWNATKLVLEMQESGSPLRPCPPTARELSAPMSDFYEMVMNKRLVHDGNPVFSWMVANTVKKEVSSGFRPDKNTQRAKNDGAVAAITCVAGFRKGPVHKFITPQIF